MTLRSLSSRQHSSAVTQSPPFLLLPSIQGLAGRQQVPTTKGGLGGGGGGGGRGGGGGGRGGGGGGGVLSFMTQGKGCLKTRRILLVCLSNLEKIRILFLPGTSQIE
jgi:hypothetical protein